MTYPAYHKDFAPYLEADKAKPEAEKATLGFFEWLLTAYLNWRQQRANREIARYLAHSGRVLTDNAEREMTQRLLKDNWGNRG